MTTDNRPYIGLMSGTSMDGIDAVLARFEGQKTEILATHSHPIPSAIRQQLYQLSQNQGAPDQLGQADALVGDLFADAALKLVERAGISPTEVAAIGSHGQTVRHQPSGASRFTLQLGDPNRIAERTGITTVADFRRRDMAAGGEGAPLAPAFHYAMFAHETQNRCVLNLGGIANITWLPAGCDPDRVIGFDTGPANGLMDIWVEECLGQTLDTDGRWAESGIIHTELLDALMEEPYLRLPYPKSTGKELFNLAWLRNKLMSFPGAADNAIQRTLLELTVKSICLQLPSKDMTVYACGGGTRNAALMRALGQALEGVRVTTTAEMGVDPQWVEGAAFAWLARQTLHGMAGNLSSVTGAQGPRVLGAVWPGR